MATRPSVYAGPYTSTGTPTDTATVVVPAFAGAHLLTAHVGHFNGGTPNVDPTVSGGGLTWTRVTGASSIADSTVGAAYFYAWAPTGFATDQTITAYYHPCPEIQLSVTVWNAGQTLGAASTQQGGYFQPYVQITATNIDSLILAGCIISDSAAVPNLGAGTTNLTNVTVINNVPTTTGSPVTTSQFFQETGVPTTTSSAAGFHSSNYNSYAWTMLAVELLPPPDTAAQLDGSSSATTTVTADLTSTVSLAGSATATTDFSGTVSAITINGDASASTTVTANLTSQVFLAGSSTADTTVTADLTTGSAVPSLYSGPFDSALPAPSDTTTATVTSFSGAKKLLAFVSTFNGSSARLISVTSPNLTWTNVTGATFSDNYLNEEIWEAWAPSGLGTNELVTATSSNGALKISLSVTVWNAAQTLGAVTHGNDGTQAPKVSITPTNVNSLIYASATSGDVTATPTVSANSTLVGHQLTTTFINGAWWTQSAPSGGTAPITLSATISPTSYAWHYGAVELLPAAAPAAPADLSGSSSATSSVSGALSTSVHLVGDSSTTSDASGQLITAVVFSGTSSATTSATASISTSVQIPGAASITSSTSGDLVNAIFLAGSASATSDAVGSLDGSALLQGDASATTSADGTLTTAIAIAGSASVTSVVTPVLTSAINMIGSSSATSSASADLATSVRVGGASSSTSSAGADLSSAIRFGGSATATSTVTADLTVVAPPVIVQPSLFAGPYNSAVPSTSAGAQVVVPAFSGAKKLLAFATSFNGGTAHACTISSPHLTWTRVTGASFASTYLNCEFWEAWTDTGLAVDETVTASIPGALTVTLSVQVWNAASALGVTTSYNDNTTVPKISVTPTNANGLIVAGTPCDNATVTPQSTTATILTSQLTTTFINAVWWLQTKASGGTSPTTIDVNNIPYYGWHYGAIELLPPAVALVGSSSATTTVAGNLSNTIQLSGSASAATTVTAGDLGGGAPLAGSTSATTTLAGTVSTQIALAGGVSATTTVTGDLTTVYSTFNKLATIAQYAGFWGHRSIGDNIIAGFNRMITANTGCGLTVPFAASGTDIAIGRWAGAYVGTNGHARSKLDGLTPAGSVYTTENPGFRSWLEDHGIGDALNNLGPGKSFAFLKEGYVDFHASTSTWCATPADVDALFELYKSYVATWQARWPNIRFLHCGSGSMNVNNGPHILRYYWFQKLRDYYGATNVCDLQLIQNTDAQGAHLGTFSEGTTQGSLPGTNIPYVLMAYDDGSGHLNTTGQDWVAARMVDWLFTALMTPVGISLVGDASATTSVSADLSNAISLSGSASVTTTVTATANSGAMVGGSTSATTSVTADLSTNVALVGSTSATSAVTADLTAPGAPTKFVTGYYAYWQQGWLALPNVSWANLSHLVLHTGIMLKAATDSTSANRPYRTIGSDDLTNLDGTSYTGAMHHFVMTCHGNGVAALIGFGGNDAGQTANFILNCSATHRQQWVDDIVAACNTWGFDGIDIDWEAPTQQAHYDDLVATMALLRQQRLSAFHPTRPNGTVYVAYPCMAVNLNKVDEVGSFEHMTVSRTADVAPYIDQINPQGYGLMLTPDWQPWYSEPIYGAGGLTPFDVSGCLAAFVRYGTPAYKLGVGLPMYGGRLGGGTQAAQIGVGRVSDFTTRNSDDNEMSIRNLYLNYYNQGTGFSANYDNVSKAATWTWPYPGFSTNNVTLITLETPQAIADKVQFIRDHGYGGFMAWSLNEGAHADGTQPEAVAMGAILAATPSISVAGSASATTTVTADLTSSIILAGTGIAPTSLSGTLSTAIPLSGTASATTTETGALTTAVRLTGASTATTSVSSNLTNAIALSGASTATTNVSGNLGTPATLEGTASATTTMAGTLTTAVRLAGASSTTSDTSGAIDTGLALFGNASTVSSVSGTLSAIVRLSGAASSASTVTATLSTHVAVGGSSTATSTASGDLTTAIYISGAASATTSALGYFIGTAAPLTGSASATTNVSGTLTTSIPLSGSVVCETSVTANPVTAIQLSGETSVVTSVYALFGRKRLLGLLGVG